MKKVCLILLLIISLKIYCQNEIKINTFINNDQRDPHIVTDNNGNYLVVWTSYNQVNDSSKEDIFLQFMDSDLNKVGNEILVNDVTEGDQIRPSVAMNDQGDFVITWASYSDFNSIYDIKAKIYKNRIATSNEFLVNTVTIFTQTKPCVDIYLDGSFIVVWESWFEDGSDRGVYGQRFFADGNKNGSPFQVNMLAEFSQAKPVVKYFTDGKFIVVWESWKQEISATSGYEVIGRLYNSTGESISDEVQINDYTLDYQWYADVITLDSDNFIVVWCSWEQDGSDGGVYLRKFNSNFLPLSAEILVNSYTRYYQWLPKLGKTPGGNIAVVWSSWQQDASREGIYVKIFDSKLNEKSFEIRLNDVTESFQWEPSIVAINDYELITVWSNYDEVLKSYDVIGKRSKPVTKEAVIEKSGYDHPSGFSTTSFLVNVIDSTQLTGDTYEIEFNQNASNQLYASIKNKNTGSIIIPEFYLNQGEDVYYLTPIFDGVAIEFKPVFSLEIDLNKSVFVNNSGSNINFNFTSPSGTTVIAPIDLVMEWGDATKNPDGTFVAPLDSAYSSAGKMEIKTPFKAWDMTNDKKLDCYVIEPSATKNKQWDPGESVVILTPLEYQHSFPNFHVQLNNSVPPGPINYPSQDDSIFIFTRRPLTTNDVYTFSTAQQYITSVNNQNIILKEFVLQQNYPNPFNPYTTISFSIPEDNIVKLKVYNLLGELVTTLKDEFLIKGTYRIAFNSKSNGLNLASGAYFYSLESGNKFIAKKMILLK